MESNKLNVLIFLDGIAIFFIVTFHVLGGFPTHPLYFIQPYLVTLGLTLFTFTAGYKFVFNHITDFDDKVFLRNYFKKRFIRLYKPYLGYSLLMLFPLLIISYGSEIVFPGKIEGSAKFMDTITNFSVTTLLQFFVGNNPIAYQLWYLIALLIITGICISILYTLNTNFLFSLFFPTLLIAIVLKMMHLNFDNISMISNTITYLPFFIFGMIYATNQHGQQENWFRLLTPYAPALFISLIIFCVIFTTAGDINNLLIYSCSFLFPSFSMKFYSFIQKGVIISPFFMYCGAYSFYIYLFQWPICLPVLSRVVTDILGLKYIFMPLLISVFGVFFCVLSYKFVKKMHLNKIFE